MKSQIEKMLRDAIRDTRQQHVRLDDYTDAGASKIVIDDNRRLSLEHDLEASVLGEDEDSTWVAMFSNVNVLTYRVDILIMADANGGWGFVAIECDGHDWHDRTKQQAAYDRARDRELLRIGIPTLRFTGSEIYHDAFRCVNECWLMVPVVNRYENELIAAWCCGVEYGKEAALKQKRKMP